MSDGASEAAFNLKRDSEQKYINDVVDELCKLSMELAGGVFTHTDRLKLAEEWRWILSNRSKIYKQRRLLDLVGD